MATKTKYIKERLTIPPSDSIAAECRSAGLVVGDVIRCREELPSGRWQEIELTVLWIGQEIAAFLERHRDSDAPRWASGWECADWDSLRDQDWYVLRRAIDAPA